MLATDCGFQFLAQGAWQGRMVSMMSAIAAVALFACGAARGQSLNLTPETHRTALEGGSSPDIAFHDGDAVVTYEPPWEYTGSHDKLLLKPRITGADASIEARPKASVPDFSKDSITSLKKELAASLPKDAVKVEWAADEPNVLLMNRHETYRVTFSFTLSAQRFTETVIVCNFEKEQLRFVLTCKETDFKKLYDSFRRSLYTFQGLA